MTWTINNVRKTFIEYFENLDHKFIQSSSVVPDNDKSLLFVNAGMNQFKDIILNKKEPEYCRAVNSQKCIRAGGKHNDLTDVGKDIYHHTFFEMLGTWSFNDYWKQEIIDWSWDILINVYKLDKDRIYVTYFGGDDTLKLDSDDETKELWKKYLPEDKILPFGMKDNFWEMGLTGPCGPCTEIHYNRSDNDDAKNLVNADHPDVIEIWNLVFMQYNRVSETELIGLSKRHVDTGAGLERLTSLLQNKKSNYDTDAFSNIIEEINKISKVHQYAGKINKDDIDNVDMAYRIIADHMRTIVVSIGDGVRPGHTKTENVLRLMIRRAIKECFVTLKMLDLDSKLESKYTFEPFLHNLADVVCSSLCEYYTYLQDQNNINVIKQAIKDEEIMYGTTLQKGYHKFIVVYQKYMRRLELKDIKIISDEDVKLLVKTHGFAHEFIEYEATKRGFAINKH